MIGAAARWVGPALVAMFLAGACTSPTADETGQTTAAPPATAPSSPPLRATGFDQERIRVAAIVDTSGSGGARGRALLAAADAFWAGVAADGGIAGQFPVEVLVIDSAGDPETARVGLAAAVDDLTMVALVDDAAVAAAIRPVLVDQGMLGAVVAPPADAYADELLLPAGLDVPTRTSALGRLLDGGGAWCPVRDGGPASTAMIDALDALGSAAPLAEPVVLAPESVLADVAVSLADCDVVWLPPEGGGRDRMLDALAAADHPGRVAVVTDEIELSGTAAGWAPGRLILGTNGPDWATPSAQVDEMVATVTEHSPGLEVTSTTAVGWTAQELVRQVLTGAFENGSFARDSLRDVATGLAQPDLMVGTWAVPESGGRVPAGPVVAVTPDDTGRVGHAAGEVVGVVEVTPAS